LLIILAFWRLSQEDHRAAWLHSEFEASRVYIVRPCLKNIRKEREGREGGRKEGRKERRKERGNEKREGGKEEEKEGRKKGRREG
jgi:hypothetical protein